MQLRFFALTLISLILTCSCRKDKTNLVYKECYNEITVVTRAHFYTDAVQFGIQRLSAETLSEYHLNPVYIEEQTIYVLGKLSAIFNAAASSPVDSPLYDIVFKYQIHKEIGTHLNMLNIVVESWDVQYDFKAHFGNTQNDELNAITNKYDFSYYNTVGVLDTVYVLLINEDEYIMSHFAKQLKGTPGIVDARSMIYSITNGNGLTDIYYSWTDEYDEFIFQYGMGDCPAGCTEFHYWKVRVDKDCNVSFIEEYGDPLPG